MLRMSRSSFDLKPSSENKVGTISNGAYASPPYEFDSVALRNYQNLNPPKVDSYPIKPSTMDPEKLKLSEKINPDSGKDEKKSEPAVQPVPFLTLFRFADAWDKLFIFLGTLFSILNGMMIPLMILIFGDIIDSFSKNDLEQSLQNMQNLTATISPHDCGGSDLPGGGIIPTMRKFALYYVGIGIAVSFFGWCQVTFWMLAAERQCYKMRIAFLRSVLYQTIGWFDLRQSGELNSRLSDDVTKIQSGFGDKLGISIQWLAAGLASFILGFIKGWQLSLVILSLCPLIGAGAYFMTKAIATLSNSESAAYAKAGAVAEEVLSNIRTVVAYSGEKKESIRYAKNLDSALKAGVKKSVTTGLGMGFTFLVMFSSYCLGFWYGAKLIRDSESTWIYGCQTALEQGFTNYTEYCNGFEGATYTPGVMVTVFFSIIFGAFGLGQSFPNFALLAASRGLARTIFDIIDSVSDIDASKNVGNRIDNGKSMNIHFSNVKFTYPTRSDVEVLRGLDLDVKVGETLALVGKSGCGKSTVVQLLQRFYDPNEGTILMGENKLHSLNVRWLREQIGVVSQEPVLFATTIAENIRYGRPDITKDEIEQAAKDANAHDFIKKLPQKYETLVGDRGAQLSGGQKQRVAIARALVRNPTLLILDEATSALDTESEAVVQQALDKACQGRTTVIIAHRLSTIQNADRIAVIKDGAVVELGNHASLMEKEGIYHRMVEAQRLGEDNDEEGELDRSKEKREKFAERQRTLSVVSAHSANPEKLDESIEKEKQPEVSLGRIIKMNSPEWFYIFVGCIAAGMNGAVQPLFAIVFAQMLTIFGETDLNQQEKDALKYSLSFLLIGVLVFIVNFMQSLMFGISGEKLTKRLRHLSFEAMLRQEMAFFDEPRNGTGALTTRLASETSSVNGATGVRLGVIMQSFGSMGIGLILAFIYGWEMSLVILAFVPFIMIAGAAATKLMIGFSAESKLRLLDGGKVACEAIDNIRTVVSLGREKEFLKAYVDKITPAHKKEINKAIIYGAAFGLSQGIIYFAYAAAFYFGATQVQSCDMTFNQVMKVVGCIIFSAMAVGQAASFAPDYGKAKVAANEIFALLDRKPLIDYTSAEGIQLETVSGNVAFGDVNFRYPSRPDVDVLKEMTFSVPAGQTLALVGTSGCGKSTCIQLLERFYDTSGGKVMLENVDIKALSINWLRSQFGLVSQEPVLFDCTVAENIAYGDNSRIVPMAEIIDAARQSNVHDFIVSLPDGYETRVGEKGGQMSGGQKQRIAIARALVRRPKILLLDEATSALDSESEKVVQAALDAARLQRTCIVIAHRLSTIQNADAIAVVQAGRIAEYGTHNELINLQGLYFNLCKAQSRL